MTKYASKTSVPVEKSIADLQRTVSRFGAERFGFMQGVDYAEVGFEVQGKAIRLSLVLPDRGDLKFWKTNHVPPRERTKEQAYEAWELECRRLWRSLVAVVKAKVVAIEDGISTLEREFLANLVLPGGKTVMESVEVKLQESYKTGQVPLLLTDGR